MGSRFRIRLTAVAGVVALLALGAPGASAQVPLEQAAFSAYSNGAVIHADALRAADTRAVDAEVAFSGATVDSQGLATQRTNEYGALVQPAQTGKDSYGRGYGLDAALSEPAATDDPQVRLAGLSEAAAPPRTGPVVNEIGPVDADPLAYASTLRGEAFAAPATGPDACRNLGADISYGLGYAENAQLLDQEQAGQEQEGLEQPVLATQADQPERNVSWSLSRNYLAPQINAQGQRVGNALALVAENRQTIAPVSINLGGEEVLTLEFLGEWVLRAHAGGTEGSSFVHYGPGDVSPETPVLRLLRQSGGGAIEEVLTVTTQQLLGDEGLVINQIPGIEIAIGEDPRAIGGGADTQPQVTATSVSAAVDVVRVSLGELGDIRVGHMEVAATVPAGGLLCPLPVNKTVTPDQVQPGDTFTYTITVLNHFACELRNVRVEDTISGDPGVAWEVRGTDPQADEVGNNRVVWNDIGPIPPGETRSATITVQVSPNSGPGVFHDDVAATAECFDRPVAGQDDAFGGVGAPLEGRFRLDAPQVIGPAPRELPRTGGPAAATVAGLALAGLALMLRRRVR